MHSNNNDSAINELLLVMRRLRDPESGCPWDIKQTWQSILPYTLEEVYEVADAVDRNDTPDLQDELGDLLFQVVFMAQIAAEQGLFDFNDVAQGITNKMVRRHPHVFTDKGYDSIAEQKQGWEAIKQQEREQSVLEKGEAPVRVFDGIPEAMPALHRAQKIQKRAAKFGFDWDHWQQVVPKIEEELREVEEAVSSGESFERVEEEVGDLIMASTNLARQLQVNAENALRLANRKFARRFEQVEQLLGAQGIALDDATLSQMESAWAQVKLREKGALV